MLERVIIHDLTIDILRKRIKNIYLRVNAVSHAIQISAPLKVSEAMIRDFVLSKMDWIKRRLNKKVTSTPLEYISGETHYFQGEPYILNVIQASRSTVSLRSPYIDFYLRKSNDKHDRMRLLNKWYREQLTDTAAELIEKWQSIIGVAINEFKIKQMKTRWGTCNPTKRRIWLSLALAKKPLHCLEYVVVHELVHLLERSHNQRFYRLMDRFLPGWQGIRKELNRV